MSMITPITYRMFKSLAMVSKRLCPKQVPITTHEIKGTTIPGKARQPRPGFPAPRETKHGPLALRHGASRDPAFPFIPRADRAGTLDLLAHQSYLMGIT